MKNKWRSCPPEQTIQNINSILYNNNLLTNTEWHNKIYDNNFNMHSCSIKFIENIGLQTNGKGITPYYAEASGKAEFLERLQSYTLTQRETDRVYFADEKIIDNKAQAPFLNLFTGEIEYLNDFTCGTTGIASGNTYEEAIVHAICEINERYCYWLLSNYQLKIHKEITSKHIDVSKFEEYYNGTIYLYDVSICDLPTVLMMFLRKENTVSISIDCAPTQEIAIERCFTELFQGINLQEKNPKCFSLITDENCSPKILYYSLVDLKNSILPMSLINYILFFDQTNKNQTFKLFSDNIDLIQTYLLNSQKIFNKLLLRDYSFLNFPTIKIIYDFNFEDSLEEYIPDVLSFYCHNFIKYHNFSLTELFKYNLSFIDTKLSWDYQNYNKLRNQLRSKSLQFQMDINNFKQFCLKKYQE